MRARSKGSAGAIPGERRGEHVAGVVELATGGLQQTATAPGDQLQPRALQRRRQDFGPIDEHCRFVETAQRDLCL